MVTHCTVDTDSLEGRVFAGGLDASNVYPHTAAMGNGCHGFKIEAVIVMGIDVMNKAIINTQRLEPQIPQVAEGHPANPEPVHEHWNL